MFYRESDRDGRRCAREVVDRVIERDGCSPHGRAQDVSPNLCHSRNRRKTFSFSLYQTSVTGGCYVMFH